MQTALLVTHQSVTAQNVPRLLTKYHIKTIVSRNGKEAFQIACNYLPDIIFLDLSLSESVWDAQQITKMVRAHVDTRRIPIIGMNETTQLAQSYPRGCNAILYQPVVMKNLSCILHYFVPSMKRTTKILTASSSNI